MKKNIAEFIGTFWLVFAGCGSAIIAANFPNNGIGLLGVSLAFGLSVLTGAYALGPISGAHFNPAVTLGLYRSGRISGYDVLPYIISQLLGAVAAAAVLYVIATDHGHGKGSFAANGYGVLSPGGYSMRAAIIMEFVTTFIFILILLGATRTRAVKDFSGLVIGFTIALIHLISIPVTNTSVNPARSISQALFAGEIALTQLWLFVLVPIVGAVAAAEVYKRLISDTK